MAKPYPHIPFWESGPLSARPNAEGLPDWYLWRSDAGGLYAVENEAWLTIAEPVEDVHFIGAAGEPAFTAAWAHFTAVPGFGQVGFWRHDKEVHLCGVLTPTGDPPAASAVFTFPAGYRPPNSVAIATAQSSAAGVILTVGTDGVFSVSTNMASATIIYLDGVSFRI